MKRKDVHKVISQCEMTLEQVVKIFEKTNVCVNDINLSVANAAFNLGIEETLKEIAILKKSELGISENSCDNSHVNIDDITTEIVILAFTEGYKIMKLIAEKRA